MLKNDTLKHGTSRTYRFIWKCPPPPPPSEFYAQIRMRLQHVKFHYEKEICIERKEHEKDLEKKLPITSKVSLYVWGLTLLMTVHFILGVRKRY